MGLNSLAGERIALTCPDTSPMPGHMQSMLSEITRICSMAWLPGRTVHKMHRILLQIVAKHVAACASKYFYVVSHTCREEKVSFPPFFSKKMLFITAHKRIYPCPTSWSSQPFCWPVGASSGLCCCGGCHNYCHGGAGGKRMMPPRGRTEHTWKSGHCGMLFPLTDVIQSSECW